MLKKIRRFIKDYKQLAFVIIVFIAGIGLDLAGKDQLAHLLLGTSALIATIPLIWGMIETLRSGMFGVDVLAITAIVTSVIMGEYWAAMVIVLMLTGGEALEDYAEGRAKVELTTLLTNKPTKAHILKANKQIEVKASEIRTGDKVIVLPGEVVPVDGEVIDGSSSFDESSLTGESMPVGKKIGDSVLSGSVNNEGKITLRASNSAADSQYEQIIKMVQAAANSQSPFVRLADRYSVPFTLIAFMIAGTAWIMSGDSLRFLQVLVVATPCPLLLGAPIALVSGMSRAAKQGIIVKNGSALERLAEVETIAFDKTGTLTEGTPSVDAIVTHGKITKNEVVALAAAVGSDSSHILSKSLVGYAQTKGIKLAKTKQVKEVTGQGLVGRFGGKSVYVGRLSLLEENGVTIPKAMNKGVAQTAIFVGVNTELVGHVTFKDHVRKESKHMIQLLNKLGIKHTLMVTGDNNTTANAIAKQVGVTDVQAECLPGDKIHAVEAVKHKPVAFVGDGVNDAPVLTAADVGIALGARGSTAASESADIVVMLDDISKVAVGVSIAKRTFSIARQAIMIGILISIALMLVFATGRFKPVQGALIQEVVDIIVILYALRALGTKRSNLKLLPKV